MQTELGNKALSARFLERIEDDLEQTNGDLFSKTPEPDKTKYARDVKDAVPQLVNVYRNRLLSGKDQRIVDPNFLENLSDAARDYSHADLFPQSPERDNLVRKMRDSLPILVESYRLEFGLPLRMR